MAKVHLATNTSFRQLSEDERPREKALNHGIQSLSDAELLSLLFGTGTAGRSVLDMAEEIIRDNEGHLWRLAGMDTREIVRRYKGVAIAKAILVAGALELGRRAFRDAVACLQNAITSSRMAYEMMRESLEHLDHEEFHVLFLSNAAVEIAREIIGVGGQTATVVDVKVIARKALEHKATRVILFHNHPSGTLRPSIQDDSLTSKIRHGLELLDIRVDDHIIISPKGYYSYNDEGRLHR